MSASVFVSFDGDCREAVLFYAEVFGVKPPQFVLYGEMEAWRDAPFSPEELSRVLYAPLTLRGVEVMFFDIAPGSGHLLCRNAHIPIRCEDEQDILRLYGALREGGAIEMALQRTAWCAGYALLTDKFGVPWRLALEDAPRDRAIQQERRDGRV